MPVKKACRDPDFVLHELTRLHRILTSGLVTHEFPAGDNNPVPRTLTPAEPVVLPTSFFIDTCLRGYPPRRRVAARVVPACLTLAERKATLRLSGGITCQKI